MSVEYNILYIQKKAIKVDIINFSQMLRKKKKNLLRSKSSHGFLIL